MELSSPFPHFLHSKQRFHQDKSLKSVVTLIFFKTIRRPELVGKGTVKKSLRKGRK